MCQRAHPRHLGEERGLRIALPGQEVDLPLELANAIGQRGDDGEDGLQRWQQDVRDVPFDSSDKVIGRATREPGPEDLDHRPDVGDEVCPAADQGFPAAQKSPVGLVRLAPVHDGPKERGIESSHPGEIRGIGAIVLAVAAVDEPQHAGVGDDDFVTEVPG